jgi:hypothetical protein
MVSLLAPPEDRCPSFPFIVTIEPALPRHVLAGKAVPANQRYAETECSPAVCRSAGRQSRHSRTDGALAGSIAANSAALISATILAFHPDLMLDTASTAACRYWQRHIGSQRTRKVSANAERIRNRRPLDRGAT